MNDLAPASMARIDLGHRCALAWLRRSMPLQFLNSLPAPLGFDPPVETANMTWGLTDDPPRTTVRRSM
jgi:hypothetical protein